MAKYITRYCTGKTAEDRREKLLTEVLLDGQIRTKATLRTLRKAIKEGVRPDQRMLDKYVHTFLLGRPTGVDLDYMMKLVRDAELALQRRKARSTS